jgi:protein SCO1/2
MQLPKTLPLALIALLTLLLAACEKSESHPLRGVVVEVHEDPPALLVDHEEIPGVMAAMTMKFGVDAATADAVRPGERIEARMRFQEGEWRLEDVRVVPTP